MKLTDLLDAYDPDLSAEDMGRPTRAEAQADVAEYRDCHPLPDPCPGCGTPKASCSPPGCCDTCQAAAAESGPAWRHRDAAWRPRRVA